jgi:transcription antitermination factor NusG
MIEDRTQIAESAGRAAEGEDRPPDRVARVFESEAPPGHRWVVVHTKSRQEKALCADLRTAGIVHYLPLYQELRSHGSRRRWVEAPLFSGYVFVRGGAELASDLRRTDRVANVIAVADQAGLIGELSQIEKAIAAGARFNPYEFLREGMPARVRRGPLKGVEGLIDRAGSPTKLILVVQTLGRATAIEVNPADVEPSR